MQPLLEMDLTKSEEFAFEAKLLLLQPSTPLVLLCVTFHNAICSKSFKTRSGQQFDEWEMAGRRQEWQ